ncbi:MAG: bifunctional histidinol-phosphatase/imidazoleglycerol-phosphate dehydratase HisB [Bacteroidia bacterium]|nr:bifunctional histidinol-phosphatase/imidazoleglycerol-phosphate dehydratase HisB [Bacteroidia bacterium]
MKKILFIDRDGTLIWEPPDNFQIDSLDKLEFIPGVFTWLGKICRELDFELVMVTNQDGLGTAAYPQEAFDLVQGKMMRALEREGIRFSEVCVDKSFEKENLPTRKPNTGMLKKYLSGDYDLASSVVIGDRITDVKLAVNLGSRAVLIRNYDDPSGWESKIDLVAGNWQEIYHYLVRVCRTVVHERNTNETKIRVALNLSGSGISAIDTGLNFFDHMLDQLARHGGLDLSITAKGDLHIDEHHTIEDTGIALGEAFAQALGNKRGIERYGFYLPMDDCLSSVAIDFGGRAWIEWSAEFKREKVGDMPAEMFYHFFKSFSDAARCNLNIKAEGDNEHHKIESIFKAFAKAIKMAVTRDTRGILPTTKGMI